MVAKSYQSLEQLSEPFQVDGRMYVNVRLKSGNTKSVRWYTEKEYAKMYGESAVPRSTDPYAKPQRDVLGFSAGYVYIFQNGMDEDDEYFKMSSARYHRLYGWYFISDEPLPSDLPFGYNPVKLFWKDVGDTSGTLYPDEKVLNAVNLTLYPAQEGAFVGFIGERLDLTLTVEKTIPLENKFGHSTMHIMKSATGETFVWTTSSKNWAVGSEHTLRGTVKDQKYYNGVAQTVLTNCRERK